MEHRGSDEAVMQSKRRVDLDDFTFHVMVQGRIAFRGERNPLDGTWTIYRVRDGRKAGEFLRGKDDQALIQRALADDERGGDAFGVPQAV